MTKQEGMEKEFALEHSPRQPLYDNLLNYPSVNFDNITRGFYYLRFMKYPYDFIVRAVKYNDYIMTTFDYRRLRNKDAIWEEIDWLHKQTIDIYRNKINSGFITFYNYQLDDLHSAAPAARIQPRKSRRAKRSCRIKRRKTYSHK